MSEAGLKTNHSVLTYVAAFCGDTEGLGSSTEIVLVHLQHAHNTDLLEIFQRHPAGYPAPSIGTTTTDLAARERSSEKMMPCVVKAITRSMVYFSSRTLPSHKYWLSGSTFRISFAYVNGIPCVIRDVVRRTCSHFDGKPV